MRNWTRGSCFHKLVNVILLNNGFSGFFYGSISVFIVHSSYGVLFGVNPDKLCHPVYLSVPSSQELCGSNAKFQASCDQPFNLLL